MTEEEEKTTTTAINQLHQIELHAHQILNRLRDVQAKGSPHTEAALIRAHSALEEALRHLREAEAPFSDLIHEGQRLPVTRVQDIEDPGRRPADDFRISRSITP
jgi:hypothetical protein